MTIPSMIRSKMEDLFGIDLRALAVFRIAIALVFLGDLLVRSTDLIAFYTDFGVLPRIAYHQTYQDPWLFSIHLASGAPIVQILLFILSGIIGISLLAGYHTWASTIAAWFLLLSLHQRNPIVIGEGIFIRVFLFWAMFLPLGERYSLDRLIHPSQESMPKRVLSMGTAAFLIQLPLTYFCSGLHKLPGPEWQSGTALFHALNYDPLTKPLGYLLLSHHGLLKFLTYVSLGIEIFGSCLLLSPVWTLPCRLFAVFIFLMFNVGFLLLLELGPIPWTMMAALIPFLPAVFWNRLPDFLPAPFENQKAQTLSSSGTAWKFRWGHSVLAAIFFAYILFSNFETFDNRFQIPYQIRRYSDSLLGLNQNWFMFAPRPPQTGGWNVIEGRLKSGVSVDLLTGGKPVSWERPRLISSTFKNQYWRKFWMLILYSGYEIPRTYYASYLCRQWNQNHTGEDQLSELEIFQMQTYILPHYQVTGPEKISYGKYPC